MQVKCKMMIYVIALLCVVGIAAGQIMFKLSAISLQRAGTFFDLKTLGGREN